MLASSQQLRLTLDPVSVNQAQVGGEKQGTGTVGRERGGGESEEPHKSRARADTGYN